MTNQVQFEDQPLRYERGHYLLAMTRSRRFSNRRYIRIDGRSGMSVGLTFAAAIPALQRGEAISACGLAEKVSLAP